jgi:putative membrane protein
MYGSYAHGGMLGGGLGMILVWTIPLVLLFLVGRFLFMKGKDGDDKDVPGTRNALDLLKEAYARGEIDRDEYLRKRDDLLEK